LLWGLFTITRIHRSLVSIISELKISKMILYKTRQKCKIIFFYLELLLVQGEARRGCSTGQGREGEGLGVGRCSWHGGLTGSSEQGTAADTGADGEARCRRAVRWTVVRRGRESARSEGEGSGRERERAWAGFIERGEERESRRGGTADINAINGVSSRKKKWGREKRKQRRWFLLLGNGQAARGGRKSGGRVGPAYNWEAAGGVRVARRLMVKWAPSGPTWVRV
jgi:hypothetical protein